MQQERIFYLLTRKLADEASEDELMELQQLMLQHPDVVYYEETLKQIKFKQEPEKDPLAAFEEFKFTYADEFEEVKPISIFTRYHKMIALAASVIIIPIAVLFYVKGHNSNPSNSQFIEIACGNNTKKKITLPDGTNVWLNANSKLKYSNASTFNEYRNVALTGEAFFDVFKDKAHPFTISTDKIKIKVLGTAFNVKAYQNSTVTEALLVHGLIELSLKNEPAQKILLRPKEKFALRQITNQLDKKATHSQLVIENVEPVVYANNDYYEETSWVDNKLVFKDEAFKVLAPKLEQRYNVSIKITSSKVENYHFTGVLENETLEQALRSMQVIRPFKFKINAHDVTIY